jgi:hypothetical protein
MKSFVASSLAAVAIMLAVASPAAAAVTYKFTAFTALQDQVHGSFTYTSPDFIRDVRRIVPFASLDNCLVLTTGSQTCAAPQQFFADSKRFFGGTVDADLVGFTGNAISYYFDLGAFQTVGLHQTKPFFGASQAGSLLVSQTAAVPEPGSWALMIGGFGMIGAAVRRRVTRSNAVTA